MMAYIPEKQQDSPKHTERARSLDADDASVRDQNDIFAEGGIDPVYLAKAHILNDALQEIGMGKYQWHLFFFAGFGWFADNLWLVVVGLILAPVVQEFNFQGPFIKLAQNLGLLFGAAFWGIGADIWGRRWSFNLTLLVIGVFATASGGSDGYVTLCVLTALYSIGVGGNLPVDSAIFLEFVPATHQYLLTVLSVWWAVGQLVGSLVAWPLIGNFSCEPEAKTCSRADNQGWRYFLFAMGGLMLICWALRFFVFPMYESPKYLMGRGRDADAVAVVHKIAAYNGSVSSLTLETLQESGTYMPKGHDGVDTSTWGAVRRKLAAFSTEHVKGLFATRKMAWSTSILIALWALIGLAFPLYQSFVTYFLATRGADFGDGSVYITYRNQVILSVIGVPGSLIAGWMVDIPLLGRRGTLAFSTILTGVFLFCSTTARSSDALLGWNCGYSFTSNIMYGVLYAVSPELFPTKDRGTGNAIVSIANRMFGVMAPIIALYADLTTSVPIFVSGALFVLAGVLALLLPYEPRGKASL